MQTLMDRQMSHMRFTSPLLPDLLNGLLGSFSRPSKAGEGLFLHSNTDLGCAIECESRSRRDEQPGNTAELSEVDCEMQNDGPSILLSRQENGAPDPAPNSPPTQCAEDT